MKITVFSAISMDGFIARRDGRLDWLPGSDGTVQAGMENEDFGYGELFSKTDALVLGRNTFEFVRGAGEWPYGNKPVVVLSQSLRKLPAGLPAAVQLMSGNPDELTAVWELQGWKHIYLDGGKTVQQFLRAGLVTELIITRVPVLIGTGIRLFGSLDKDLVLHHKETRSWDNGFVQSRYRCK